MKYANMLGKKAVLCSRGLFSAVVRVFGKLQRESGLESPRFGCTLVY